MFQIRLCDTGVCKHITAWIEYPLWLNIKEDLRQTGTERVLFDGLIRQLQRKIDGKND